MTCRAAVKSLGQVRRRPVFVRSADTSLRRAVSSRKVAFRRGPHPGLVPRGRDAAFLSNFWPREREPRFARGVVELRRSWSRPEPPATARGDFLAGSLVVYNGAQGNGIPRQAIATAGRRNAPDL